MVSAEIKIEKTLGIKDSYRAWDMYVATFAGIDELAIQRHLMTFDEFEQAVMDERIDKYVARADGEIVGLGMQTNDLEAWSLVSPRVFARRWPDLYEAHRIWYVGFVGVAPGWQGSTLFRDLIVAMAEPAVKADGMSVMDFCAHNVDERQLPRASQALLRRVYPDARGALLDRQEFWGFRFDGIEPK